MKKNLDNVLCIADQQRTTKTAKIVAKNQIT